MVRIASYVNGNFTVYVKKQSSQELSQISSKNIVIKMWKLKSETSKNFSIYHFWSQTALQTLRVFWRQTVPCRSSSVFGNNLASGHFMLVGFARFLLTIYCQLISAESTRFLLTYHVDRQSAVRSCRQTILTEHEPKCGRRSWW